MGFEHNPYNTEDNSKFVSQTTPSKTKTLCKVTLPADYVIPIIFIPGIMGSNIQTKAGQHVWYPPNGKWNGYKAAQDGKVRTAAMRQTELNPENTIVGQDGEIDEGDLEDIQGFDIVKARLRGWGSVWWQGYSQILIYLEKYLNHELIKGKPSKKDLEDPSFFAGTKEWRKIVATQSKSWFSKSDESKLKDIKKEWGPLKDIELLTKDLHGELANYSFPVFAIGYNWLQDNDKSATYVAEMMKKYVKAQIQKEFPNQKFKKFIIVTHSMGGLVTRALINNPSIKDEILGVVHGVMPASGAPTVYQRICRGWEGKEVTGNFADNIAKHIFGATSERLTPVLGNSVGGMQLLPFANFLQHLNKKTGTQSKEWLILQAKNRKGETVTARLPQKDPYSDIYTRTNRWWSMINENFLDPNGSLSAKLDAEKKSSVIDFYLDNVLAVENFHNKISDSYHPNSFAHYGRDAEHLAYNEVLWSTEDILPIDTANDLIEYNGYARFGEIENTENEEIAENSELEENDFPAIDDPTIRVIEIEPVVVTAKKNHGLDHLFDEDGFRIIESEDKKTARFTLRIQPTSEGDGTVCGESGADVEKRQIQQVFVMRGLNHAESYDDKNVQRSTIYSIAKIMEKIC